MQESIRRDKQHVPGTWIVEGHENIRKLQELDVRDE